MKTKRCPAYGWNIYIAGDALLAQLACQRWCKKGLCVTVTPTTYVYKYGAESGVVVGLINYPRFPSTQAELEEEARALALFLMDELSQGSCTVQPIGGAGEATFMSRREGD